MTLLLSVTLLAACSVSGPVTDGCAGWTAFRPSKQSVLTPEDARWALGHNGNGVARGCWEAPR